MNILVLDCAVSKISIAVKFDDKMIAQTYDIGMRQSEILVPAIDDILKKAGITAGDLDFSAITIGPGSFTGLRLGISSLKAIELAYNVPIYGVSSLKVYSYAAKNLGFPVLCCIDANKDRFYACPSITTHFVITFIFFLLLFLGGSPFVVSIIHQFLCIVNMELYTKFGVCFCVFYTLDSVYILWYNNYKNERGETLCH